MIKIKKDDCVHCNRGDEYVEDIICNKCGKTCKVDITADHKHFNYEGLRARLSGGYGSRWDEQTILFDLCEPCTIELTKSFSIPVQIEDVGMFDDVMFGDER